MSIANSSEPPIALSPAQRASLRVALAPALLALAVAVGVALRLTAADGDLWLDEVSTLLRLKPIHSLRAVFLDIPRDNNHYLNSAWLWAIGLDAPVLLMRAQAMALGALGVLAAYAAGRRFHIASGVVAAFLVSGGYFFVHYGSEARGYAGLILAILVAYAALQAILDEGPSLARWRVFGAAVCFGVFSHLLMVEGTFALCVAAVARIFASKDARARKLRLCAQIAAVAALAAAPAIGCFLYGFLQPGAYRAGDMFPFTYESFLFGLAGVARAILGFPEAMSNAAVVTLSAIISLFFLAIIPARRRWFPIVAIFALPALHAAIGLPCAGFPRFQMATAMGFTLLAADGLGALWARGGHARAACFGALALIGTGQSVELAHFFRDGRGHYTAALERIAARGPALYAIDPAFAAFETQKVAAYLTERAHIDAAFVADEDFCQTPPQWLIAAASLYEPFAPPQRKTAGPAACRASFKLDRVYKAWGLSGFYWTLYAREDAPAQPGATAP